MKKQKGNAFIGGVVGVLILGLLMIFILVPPLAGPWMAEKKGEAEYRRAEQNRKIRVQEAKAKQESAEYLAQAEITKAEGVAKANDIMSKSLGGPEGYLRWKYIEMLEENGQDSNTIVYIPTEATMPVLEAGRVSQAAPTVLTE